jgi:hypothetical protein
LDARPQKLPLSTSAFWLPDWPFFQLPFPPRGRRGSERWRRGMQ